MTLVVAADERRSAAGDRERGEGVGSPLASQPAAASVSRLPAVPQFPARAKLNRNSML